MAQIELTDVRKSFDSLEVIHGVNLSVPDGCFVVVVGPSGCGKSTLLRMVAGLEDVSAGAIAIGGRDVTALEPKDRNVAMVFQNYALYPHLTVARNIAFGLELRGTPKAEIKQRVERAASILHLDGLLERKPRQLSGGQRQRVAMGRAIVREPDVFLFDEPLSNLDAKLRVTMRLEIRRIHESLGATSLYVTHDQVEAMTMGDVLVVMNDGHVEQIGAPLDVYERPASTFVASFIGSPPMNFLTADIEDREVRFDAGRMTMHHAELPRGSAILGVRPEHLRIDPEATDFEMSVRMVEAHGAETIVHGISGRHDVTVRLAGSHRIRPQDILPLAAERGHLHLFDIERGRRIA
ncbi:sn-glycerol-3-phosphate ABC transporter ATP-binding protein UgpC [Thalassobaculum sp. OXR-137]|uniref:ABC transporter ATP-binding protein n=1 Tax=Thalassobaculum sp. OXR-137 TaxID=3100173 RepID=UPI002AC9DA88|nr:sn-glycerol-3-phosphate ABC transporter ATP-binding protein UgpC [Thalassobaculum sp. OXR-137]WPZ35015.1 sn-glycerol-3-phosphate ABC transporter ATP-binding protein UgpC [Thalassobaculum sp. OXR-137]